MVDNVHRE